MGNELSIYLNNTYSKLILLCGGAGAGKTSFTKNYPTTYELDSAFINDSEFRKQLLKHKSKDFGSYLDVCAMQSWIDWDKATNDVDRLLEIVTGIGNLDNFHGRFVLVNGAIVSPGFASAADEIIYVYVDQQTRFKRLVERDSFKRSFDELLERFVITNYAENMCYANLFKHHANKIKVVDKDFNFLPHFDLNTFNNEGRFVPYLVR